MAGMFQLLEKSEVWLVCFFPAIALFAHLI